MVLNRACAVRYVELPDAAVEVLESRERPVTVLPALAADSGLSPALSPGLGTLGLMLPYTAVHYLLFHALLGKPAGTERAPTGWRRTTSWHW
jgi:hydrogenase maturation protein HypF